MTLRLYYTDATLRSFVARVVGVENDGRTVFLDRTAFYPTSGGQQHDLGILSGVPVVDVVDREEHVAHVLGRRLDAGIGDDVRGEIDWNRRFDHMQQHTGQHLLSAVLDDQLQLPTVSVHFGAESSTLDVADASGQAGVLDAEQLAGLERRANEIVAEARPVTVTFEDAASASGLRKPSDRTGELRVIGIGGVDRSACGGTHVSSTAAIGPILLRRQEKVRQGLRIEFTCGRRAVERARRDLEQLSRIARLFSASIDEAAALVEAQAAQLRDLESTNKRLSESLASHRARELHGAAVPDDHGVRRIVERVTTGGADASRLLALAVSALPSAVFIGASHSPPSILLATSADSGIDAGKTLRLLLEQVGGRGGGSPRLAQGSAPTADAVDRIATELASPDSALGPGASSRRNER